MQQTFVHGRYALHAWLGQCRGGMLQWGKRVEGFFETPKATRRLRGLKNVKDDNKPKLELVASEGKQVDAKAQADKLTARQEQFAQCLADGLTNSEAYRRSYSAEGMKPSSVHVEGCKLAKNPKVASRVQGLLMAKAEENAKRNSMFALKNADRVWSNVWRLAEGSNVPPAVQQSALALAAKMAGMLTEQVKIENVSSDSATLEKELVERLQRLSRAG